MAKKKIEVEKIEVDCEWAPSVAGYSSEDRLRIKITDPSGQVVAAIEIPEEIMEMIDVDDNPGTSWESAATEVIKDLVTEGLNRQLSLQEVRDLVLKQLKGYRS